MANKMLIDATHPEETRVVVLRGNRVEEFDFESAQRKQLRGNIYLAKVTRVEPSLQAAFVDYGGNRHGFLAFSEIHPDYYQIPVADRQALIEEEERAQRDADAEMEKRAGRRRQPHRRRGHRDDVVRSEALAKDAEAADGSAGEVPSDEAHVDDVAAAPTETPVAAADEAVREDTSRETAEVPLSEDAPAAGEPPALPAEFAFAQQDAEAHAPEPHAVEAEASGEDVSGEIARAAEDEAGDAASGDDDEDEDDDDENENDAEEENDGEEEENGAEEEEEVVESVGGSDALEEVQERMPRLRRQYKIQEVIKRRQVMLVQVVKEERGTKGAALTTYLSLAGRYSVLMPNTARGGGISRKITNVQDRKRLKEIAQELEVPEGMGVILRTAGANRTKTEVKRDFEYLLRMWETVRDLTLRSTAPTLVYEEGSLIKRSIRDLYSKDIEEVIVAGDAGFTEAKDFMRMLMPSHAKYVKPYKDSQPIFSRMGIESQLDAMFSPVVQLRSGGYIVLNQTEALVSIDVNSGKATREHHIEDTALKTNLEAAEEIARQLRLRDLAGLVVIDFIDMDEKRNNRAVERRLKECLKNDRARIQVGRISHFGLLEMSRQRIRTSVFESSTEKCPHCGGTGHLRSVSSLALQVLRSIEETLIRGATHNLNVKTRPEVAIYVLNQKRAHLRALEERFRITITIHADEGMGAAQPFTIEKGEMVHTPEAAKAIAAAQPANVIPFSEAEAEPETDAEFEGEDEFEAEAAQDGEEREEERADADGGEGRRRRRRRRRGRRGGGEAREGEAREGGAFAADAEQAASGEEFEGSDEVEAEDAEPAPVGAESTGDAREGRRRRRGRRGGRRNRHEREGGVGAQSFETEIPGDEQPALHLEQQPEFADDAFSATRLPPVDAVATPAPVETAPAAPESIPAEPPRRRSTVREPAPGLFSEPPVPATEPVETAAEPVPPAEPVTAEPVAAEPEPAAEPEAAPTESRPRRTGWWRRRA